MPAVQLLWPKILENMVVLSLFYTSEASLTHVMFVSALKIVKRLFKHDFLRGPIFFFAVSRSNLPTNPRSRNLGPVPPCQFYGLRSVKELFVVEE